MRRAGECEDISCLGHQIHDKGIKTYSMDTGMYSKFVALQKFHYRCFGSCARLIVLCGIHMKLYHFTVTMLHFFGQQVVVYALWYHHRPGCVAFGTFGFSCPLVPCILWPYTSSIRRLGDNGKSVELSPDTIEYTDALVTICCYILAGINLLVNCG